MWGEERGEMVKKEGKRGREEICKGEKVGDDEGQRRE